MEKDYEHELKLHFYKNSLEIEDEKLQNAMKSIEVEADEKLFVKVTSKYIDYTDDDSKKTVFTTVINTGSFFVLKKGKVVDAFFQPLSPFMFRTMNDIEALNEIYKTFQNDVYEIWELDEFEEKPLDA